MAEQDGVYREGDHPAVQNVEQHLSMNNFPCPAIGEFDCSVDGTDEDDDSTEAKADEHQLDIACGDLEDLGHRGQFSSRHWPFPLVPDKELRSESDVYADCDHLKYDPDQHDVSSCLRAVAILEGLRGGGTTDGLNDQGDNISRAENNRVPLRADATVLRTQIVNESTENDEVRCNEGCGGDDGSCNLHQVRVEVVDCLTGPESCRPAQDFPKARDDYCGEEPP